MDFIQQNWVDVWTVITSIVTIASIIAKFTPNKWDDSAVARTINFFALNKK